MQDLSGTTLKGRYRLQARIGTGGFASVYRAHDAHLGKVVAVKVLHPAHTKDIKDLERFRNEAAIAARIDDELLVRVTDYGEDGRYFFFVMEHLVGQSLRDELRQLNGRPMSWVRTFRIAEQVCAALEVAHAHDIVHRDVKPENIFVTKRRKVEAIKLLDLGIAKILQDEYWSGLQKNLSNTNDIIGSPCYIAPEQIQGARNCDVRVDIYALGIVLYELVTGVVPFRGNNVYETMFQHVNARPVPPTVRVPGLALPTPLEGIILRALEKDPKDRFRTVHEMSTSIVFEMNHLRGERPRPRPAQFLPALSDLANQDTHDAEGPGASGGRPAASMSGIRDYPRSAPQEPERASDFDSDRTTPKRALNPNREPGAAPIRKTVALSPVLAFRPAEKQEPRRDVEADDLTPAGTKTPPKEQTLQTNPEMVADAVPVREPAAVSSPLPLSGGTKFMLGSLVAASFMVTCSVSTVLAMTVDTRWIDHRLEGFHRGPGTRIEEEVFDRQDPPQPEAKVVPPVESTAVELEQPVPAVDPGGSPEPPAGDPPAGVAPSVGSKAPPAPSAPRRADGPKSPKSKSGSGGAVTAEPGTQKKDDESGDIFLPVDRTMRGIAKGVTGKIKARCKISFLSSVDRADYKVVFQVDIKTGAIVSVEPDGQLLPFTDDKCVEKQAKALIGSFQGASDLQERFPFSYAVVKQ